MAHDQAGSLHAALLTERSELLMQLHDAGMDEFHASVLFAG